MPSTPARPVGVSIFCSRLGYIYCLFFFVLFCFVFSCAEISVFYRPTPYYSKRWSYWDTYSYGTMSGNSDGSRPVNSFSATNRSWLAFLVMLG